jgi:hypothetical protein
VGAKQDMRAAVGTYDRCSRETIIQIEAC